MDNQKFTPISGFEGLYSINEFGEVLSLRTGNILAQSLNTYGYKQVGLYKKYASKIAMIHRLLAEIFIPNPNNYDCVNHKDGDKLNNSIDNLEWCTKAANNLHARENGLHRGGGMKKPIVRIGNNDLKEYDSAVSAQKEGFSARSISQCVNGRIKSYKGYRWKLKDAS
jgi:hypothetical protein